ncbi:ABC transporter ATP-binding protein [Jiangella endophytica]|uniref:ABC transporter ATP-binding protein n=1 Tax=Jiangella endophytica TaxID=1623398 RepID=UPI0018E575A5|nr:ABC transporter ATP-binding protein [Jiangella endophytica]
MTITATRLTKRFGDKTAVDGVEFEVGEGEFFVLVGPSGCGKTTTLRMIAGLESIDDGELRMNSVVVNETRPRDRDIAMVFQDYAIFPHLSVRENIAYGLRSRRVATSVIKQKVPEAAATFRIDHLLRRKPRQLSGGERQRVALARALVRDAQAYLYDEPLSNLDAQLRHQAREDILALHQRQRKPTVYVTHDQSEAMSMADRMAVMRGGRIEQVGTPRELYENPVSAFVAFFIGTPSINLFEATLRADADDVWLEAPAFSLRLPPTTASAVAGRVGGPVTVGIRPEDLHPPRQAPFDVGEHNKFTARVELIEPTTAGSTVYLTVPGPEGDLDIAAGFTARLPDRFAGEQVPLAVDLGKVHLFDPVTERSLLLGAGAA